MLIRETGPDRQTDTGHTWAQLLTTSCLGGRMRTLQIWTTSESPRGHDPGMRDVVARGHVIVGVVECEWQFFLEGWCIQMRLLRVKDQPEVMFNTISILCDFQRYAIKWFGFDSCLSYVRLCVGRFVYACVCVCVCVCVCLCVSVCANNFASRCLDESFLNTHTCPCLWNRNRNEKSRGVSNWIWLCV